MWRSVRSIGLDVLQPCKRQRIALSHVAKYPAAWEDWLLALSLDDSAPARYIAGYVAKCF